MLHINLIAPLIVPNKVRKNVLCLVCLQKPNSETRWRAIAEEFCRKWNFPQCLGSIDGKHVQIVAPEHSGSLYFNYKGTFSIVLLGVADANYNFLYADVGCQGRISDGGVFKYTSLYEDLERKRLNVPGEEPLPVRTKSVPFVFVGDDAFALSTYMMKPYAGRTPGASSPERIYNYRLSRARRVIENVFGIMSSKFRVLLKPIALNPDKVEAVVLTCIYLHNFLRRDSLSRRNYTPHGTFDSYDDDGNLILGSWRREWDDHQSLINLQNIPRRINENVHEIRNEFRDYFVSPEGAVPWQDDVC